VKGLAVAVEEGTQVTIEPGRKYFVNVGSVGQPRDGDWRAAYVLYDMATGHISLHRVEYDIVAVQNKILAAGLPVQLADRLALGK
jgi:diadenosine tetraphosphatase ApaH/serine/threonine PP2A family protein phosphatase